MSRSTYEKWLKQCPEEAAALRDCGTLYINRKAVRGWGETTAGYELILTEGIDAIGVADLINSVYAVKHLVFDEKKLSMQRLCDALAADFQGCEDVKLLCDRCEKYGNDCKETQNDIISRTAQVS